MQLNLKLAILTVGKTQRQLSVETGIPETRLSSIVCGWVDATDAERTTLARILAQPATALFKDAGVQTEVG